jgi:5S rRNA maturation endonuclease (ribonuclease M5)
VPEWSNLNGTKRAWFRAMWLSAYAGSNPAARICEANEGSEIQKNFCCPQKTMNPSNEIKAVIEEMLALIEKEKYSLVIVEGKKDKVALEELGFNNIIILDKPLYEIIEQVNVKRVILLTDLDKEGRNLYSKLKKELDKRGVVVDNRLRNLLFKTELRQIEGLTSYLKKVI